MNTTVKRKIREEEEEEYETNTLFMGDINKVTEISVLILKSIGVLLLLLIALPFNCVLTLFSLLIWNNQTKQSTKLNKTVLVTGGKMTKSLQLCRSFYSAGYRVILVETEKYWLTGHRYSNCVSRFYTVPKLNKRDGSMAFINRLVEIIQLESVDYYVPCSSPVSSYYESRAKAAIQLHAPKCTVIHSDMEIVQMLDDKFAFSQQAKLFNLNIPHCFKITNAKQILFHLTHTSRTYILKSLAYDSVRRLNLTQIPCATPDETMNYISTLPISEDNPWIMQEYIQGQEYCTHSTCHQGEITMFCCCKSSSFQINYKHIKHEPIFRWVKEFIRESNLTGQVSFDFIERQSDGQVFAIECNPRTHSAITMFYNHPHVANAYFNNDQMSTIVPLESSKPTYWFYHEVWRLLTEVRTIKHLFAWLNKILDEVDAIYATHDPLPFLMVHHWQIPLLILYNLRQLKDWTRIDFNIGKLVELDGD